VNIETDKLKKRKMQRFYMQLKRF